MTGGTAKSVLSEFFEVEDTASGFIAKCPDCQVRFAVNVKADKVADGYVQLLMSHAEDEHLTLEKDKDVRDWLSGEWCRFTSEGAGESRCARGPASLQDSAPGALQLRELTKAQ